LFFCITSRWLTSPTGKLALGVQAIWPTVPVQSVSPRMAGGLMRQKLHQCLPSPPQGRNTGTPLQAAAKQHQHADISSSNMPAPTHCTHWSVHQKLLSVHVYSTCLC
jgi:hypothetical protein